MQGDFPDDGETPEPTAEGWEGEGGPGSARNAARAVVGADAGRGIGEADWARPSCDAADLLGDIGDSLIQAHHYATLDGDTTTVLLIERALFHVGRRLARRLTAVEAGVSRH